MSRRSRAFKGKRRQPKPSVKFGLQPNPTARVLSTLATAMGNRQGSDVSFLGIQHLGTMPPPTVVQNGFEFEPKTLGELLSISSASDLAKIDLARMNLLCASALPATKGLDIDHALSVLDKWARRVALETDRHLYRVQDPRFAARYNGSEPHFRNEMLAQVLQEDLGVRYNRSVADDFSFADPSVAFIHGMIPAPRKTTAETPGGTCATMPVLYVAVGRRLGYPLKLVTAHSHLFARWDGVGHANPVWRESFNCETTNGFHKYDDNYYHTWPHPVTEQQIARNGYLKSLSPAEELAGFLASRGHHGMDLGKARFAARCYENASRYDPSRPCYRSWLVQAIVERDRAPLQGDGPGRYVDGMPRPPGPFDDLGLPEHVKNHAERVMASCQANLVAMPQTSHGFTANNVTPPLSTHPHDLSFP